MSDISHDVYCMRMEFVQSVSAVAMEWTRPSIMLRPTISLDGNKWCALYGDNLQDGVAGFGDTPEEAFRDFDKNWREQRIGVGAP